MAIQPVEIMKGVAGATVRQASTDSSAAITITELGTAPSTFGGQRAVVGAKITVETQSIRIAFGTAAVQTGGSEVGHLFIAGSVIEIQDGATLRACRIISAANGVHGVIQTTPYYGSR